MAYTPNETEVFVIAEAGVNHNGSVDLAHQLVDAAAELGADAVKFQTFVPELLVNAEAPTATYQRDATGARSQAAMLNDLALPTAAWTELARHATDAGVEFMSTAFDEPSLDDLVDIGVQRLKIPSGELTNLAFIERVAAVGLPVIMSTGMGDLAEVQNAVQAAHNADDLTLMHCVSAYPAPLEQANLRAMATMRDETGLPVGWSDHCPGTLAVAIAVAYGATVVERHLTLDRTMTGPDHLASDDPARFAEYLSVIAQVESAIGDGVKRAQPCELDVRAVARRGWHARHDLAAGSVIRAEDIIAVRPALGIGVNTSILGAVVTAPIRAGEAVSIDHLQFAMSDAGE